MEPTFLKSKKKGKILVHEGYLFRINRRTKDKSYWICTHTFDKKCKATATLDKEGTKILSDCNCHNHPADPLKIEATKFYELVKRIVKEHPSAPMPELHRKAVSQIDPSSDFFSKIPPFNQMRQFMYNTRHFLKVKAEIPISPKSRRPREIKPKKRRRYFAADQKPSRHFKKNLPNEDPDKAECSVDPSKVTKENLCQNLQDNDANENLQVQKKTEDSSKEQKFASIDDSPDHAKRQIDYLPFQLSVDVKENQREDGQVTDAIQNLEILITKENLCQNLQDIDANEILQVQKEIQCSSKTQKFSSTEAPAHTERAIDYLPLQLSIDVKENQREDGRVTDAIQNQEIISKQFSPDGRFVRSENSHQHSDVLHPNKSLEQNKEKYDYQVVQVIDDLMNAATMRNYITGAKKNLEIISKQFSPDGRFIRSENSHQHSDVLLLNKSLEQNKEKHDYQVVIDVPMNAGTMKNQVTDGSKNLEILSKPFSLDENFIKSENSHEHSAVLQLDPLLVQNSEENDCQIVQVIDEPINAKLSNYILPNENPEQVECSVDPNQIMGENLSEEDEQELIECSVDPRQVEDENLCQNVQASDTNVILQVPKTEQSSYDKRKFTSIDESPKHIESPRDYLSSPYLENIEVNQCRDDQVTNALKNLENLNKRISLDHEFLKSNNPHEHSVILHPNPFIKQIDEKHYCQIVQIIDEPINASKKRKRNSREEHTEKPRSMLVPDTMKKDDLNVYGDYVVSELRKVSPRALALAKHKINNILFEATIGNYDFPSIIRY